MNRYDLKNYKFQHFFISFTLCLKQSYTKSEFYDLISKVLHLNMVLYPYLQVYNFNCLLDFISLLQLNLYLGYNMLQVCASLICPGGICAG